MGFPDFFRMVWRWLSGGAAVAVAPAVTFVVPAVGRGFVVADVGRQIGVPAVARTFTVTEATP